jgi:cytochrome bd-type quinol oxidase subunit 2
MDKVIIVQTILICVVIIFVLYEIVLNLNQKSDDTSNIILYEATQKNSLFIPFGIGAIAGHLFLGNYNEVLPNKAIFGLHNEISAVLGIAVICLLLFIFAKKIKTRSKPFLTILLLIGLAYGHFFWSMND